MERFSREWGIAPPRPRPRDARIFRSIVTTHHARISPTAKLAAFLRAETDIPYCRQIADMCDAEEVSRTFDPGFIANHRAYIELRFKSLNAFIHRLGFRQVLEFAGGVAPRGLILSEDPSMLIVETDLPELLEEKRTRAAGADASATRPLNIFSSL